MITPQEKAKELVIKYYNEMNPDAPDCSISYRQAKQCALIAVGEILLAVVTIADKKYEYWQEVKREIEKL